MSIQWRKTTLRVTELASNIDYFTKHFGFTLLRSSDASADLAILRTGESGPSDPKAADAVDFVLAYDGQVLELELSSEGGLHNGNTDPYRGFGHIAVNAGDVYKVCDKLVADGVKFKKLPDEGRMKGLAFAFGPEPEQYWIEIVERTASVPADWPTFNLSQTMLRVKSVDESVKFYNKLGMKVVAEKHFGPESGDFSLYFLACVSDERLAEAKKAAEGADDVQFAVFKSFWEQLLELTHNHGTEDKEGPVYATVATEPKMGFSHLTFVADAGVDVQDAVDGVLSDPDGYQVRIQQKK